MIKIILDVWRTLRQIKSAPLNRAHPGGAIARYARWQIGSRLLDKPVVVPFGQRSSLMVTAGMEGATQNIYCGLHEFEDMAFILHAVSSADVFVDIGANIGSYTILASEVGAKCIAFEPAPVAFEWLRRNVLLNEADAILHNLAVGAEDGEILFTTTLDSMNHVLAWGEHRDEVTPVRVVRLDDALSVAPTVIKIDVEGFEKHVLAGGRNTFTNPMLRAVIMELNGSAMRYGVDDMDVYSEILELGFRSFAYDPFSRRLNLLDRPNSKGNTLFLRNPELIGEELMKARTCTINNVSF